MTDVKVPGIGHLNKKQLYIGGGLVVVVIGVAMYERSKKAAAAAAAAAAASTTSGTSDIDPATGDVTGSPEDIAALEAQSSYANDTAYGYSSGGDVGSGTGTVQSGFTSNSQWAQAAETYLVQESNADAATVAAALGAYITGSPVTTAQMTVIEQAIAFEGYPPQPGTNGYPPAIKTVTTTGGGSPPGGSGPGQAGASLPPPGTQIVAPVLTKAGESWNSIGAHFGIAGQHLQNFNGGGPFKVGVDINVPLLIKPGMTLSSVANLYGLSIPHLQEFLPQTVAA